MFKGEVYIWGGGAYILDVNLVSYLGWGGLYTGGVFTEFYGILILFYICIYIIYIYLNLKPQKFEMCVDEMKTKNTFFLTNISMSLRNLLMGIYIYIYTYICILYIYTHFILNECAFSSETRVSHTWNVKSPPELIDSADVLMLLDNLNLMKVFKKN